MAERDDDTESDDDAKTLTPEVEDPPTLPITPPARDLGEDTRGDDARYVRKALLGEGAMGEVHLCHDARIGRDVARKTIRGGQTDSSSLRQRFTREASVQGQLEHPAIVPVYDFARDPDGAEYFTMRRVQGRSLHEVLKGLRRDDPDTRARYGQRRLLAAFATICLAVAYAHSRGVIHRDIKPSNIMLGGFGEVYLLDWGVARIARSGSIADIEPSDGVRDAGGLTTEVGITVGTIGYMSPEQAMGHRGDERSDVYSLGAVLFEILVGRPLHGRDRAKAMWQTLHGVDTRRELEATAGAGPLGLPPELADLCVRATLLDPGDRPQTATAMHDEVQRYLDGERDVQRRREEAQLHASAAVLEAHDATVGGRGAVASRERAFLELSRALALDPSNVAATEALEMLILRSPPGTAEATNRELYRSVDALRRLLSRLGVVQMGVWALGVAWGVAAGLHPGWASVELAAVVFAGFAAYYNSRSPTRFRPWLLLLSTNLAASVLSGYGGVLLTVPALLCTISSAFALGSRPMRWAQHNEPDAGLLRIGIVTVPVLSLLTPVVLEAFHIVPPSVEIRDGAIVILPRIARFTEGAYWLFVAAGVACIVACTLFALRVRDYAFAVESRAVEAATQLSNLLPPHARGAAGNIATGPTPLAARRHGGVG